MLKDLTFSASAAKEVSAASSKPLLTAILLSSILFLISLLLLGVTLPELMEKFVQWITPVFNKISNENNGGYDAFLIAIATVVGLFLTLYLTNLSTLAGSLYAKLPKALRDLYIQDRVGNGYVGFLIFLTVGSIFVLGVSLLTDFRPKLILYFFGLLSLFAIQAFAILGQRAFRFFDPTTLVGEMFARAALWIEQATINGFLWNDRSFQNHYHTKLASILNGIRTLLDVANEENNLKKEPLRMLHSEVSRFLAFYVSQKRIIPTKSFFFTQVIEHRSWYLTEHTDVDLATKTHTDLLPKKKQDTYWFENQVIDGLFKIFSACLIDRKEIAAGMIEDYSLVISSLGKEWEIEFARRKLDTLAGDVFKMIEQHPENERATNIDLSLLELVTILPINLFLEYVRYFEETDFVDSNFIKAKDFLKQKAVYGKSFPAPILNKLEIIYEKLLFERLVEGKNVTPDWGVRQEAFQGISFSLKKNFEILSNEINRNIYSKANKFVEKQNFLAAMVLIGRGLEYNHKLLTHLPRLQDVSVQLAKAKIEPTLPWPSWDWDKEVAGINDCINVLYKLQSECIAGLSLSKPINELPDFFGKAVHFAGELCFKYGRENDLTNLKGHFANYFYGAMQMFDKLREETKDWLPESAVHAFSQPFVELVELSGYIIFFAEYHKNPELWEFSKSIWDEYFRREAGNSRFTQIDSILSIDKKSFRLSHRQFRTQWKMYVDQLLRNAPRRSRKHASISPFYYATEIDHDSRLVRRLGGASADFPMSIYDGVDIFVDQYLSTFAAAKGMDFGTRHVLREEIIDEENWDSNTNLPNRGD